MKRVLLMMVLIAGVSGGIGGMLLAGEATNPPTTRPAEKNWVCPMNCPNSASDKPGKCPVCGMKLERAKKGDKDKSGDKAHKKHQQGDKAN